MSTYVLRLNERPFESIKAGSKTIEMRLLDEKRKAYNVGDVLIFKKRPDEIEELKVQITALHMFGNFNELYKKFNKINLGYAENEIAKPEDMLEYYSKEEQEKYGVVGIEIKLIKN